MCPGDSRYPNDFKDVGAEVKKKCAIGYLVRIPHQCRIRSYRFAHDEFV
jgi:hypothetical protein